MKTMLYLLLHHTKLATCNLYYNINQPIDFYSVYTAYIVQIKNSLLSVNKELLNIVAYVIKSLTIEDCIP